METIGMVIALQAEARAIAGFGLWSPWKRVKGRRRLRTGLPGAWLLCVCSGMGAERAKGAAEWLVGEGVRALLSVGVSAGLSPGIEAGDIVLARSVSSFGAGVINIEPSYLKQAVFSLAGKGLRVHEGPLVTSDGPVLTAREKKAIFNSSRALAADMESAAVGRVAMDAGLPFFAFRAVSDTARCAIPRELFECVGGDGSLRAMFLTGRLARKPSLIKDLLRARRDFSAARHALNESWPVIVNGGLPTAMLAASGAAKKPAP